MTEIEIDKLLHHRIIDKCKSLYEDGHFPQAALESNVAPAHPTAAELRGITIKINETGRTCTQGESRNRRKVIWRKIG